MKVKNNKYCSNQFNNKLTQSFFFPFLLSYFDLNIPENSQPIIQYVFGMTILSLIALLSFINLFIYLFIMYSINHYDLENKYPKFKWIINYYKKTSFFIIVIEFTLGFISLFSLFIFSLLLLKQIFIS
jgi:hypothetical protein